MELVEEEGVLSKWPRAEPGPGTERAEEARVRPVLDSWLRSVCDAYLWSVPASVFRLSSSSLFLSQSPWAALSARMPLK